VRKYVAEFLGTMFLVLAIGMTGNALVIGLTLAAMIYIGGHVSNAHYNPAVTLAHVLRGSLKGKEVTGYVVGQVLGAFAATAIMFLLGIRFFVQPSTTASLPQIVVVEILFTFLLASTVLAVATAKPLKGNHIYGFAIGTSLAVGILMGGDISGGVYNPAVAIGAFIFNALDTPVSMLNMAIYLIGPLSGGILAAIVFMFLNKEIRR